MNIPLPVLAAAALAGFAVAAAAAPPPGSWRPAGSAGAYPGGTYVRPGSAAGTYVRPGYPVFRPGYPAYRPGYPGYRPGWNAGYWGPRGGWYYGGPGYWGAWPYATAWGVGLGSYAFAYPYPSAPLMLNGAVAPQVIIEQPVAPAPLATAYWYYCVQPAGYHPYVQQCSQPWMKVVPQRPGEEGSPPQVAR